jgi:hypothetical protein
VLTGPVLRVLDEYLAGRTFGAPFITKAGRRMGPREAWRMVRRIAKRAELDGAGKIVPTPYGSRLSMAWEAATSRMAATCWTLDREIKDLNKLITARFGAHSLAKSSRACPAPGPILGAEFIAITAADLAASVPRRALPRTPTGPRARRLRPTHRRAARTPAQPPPAAARFVHGRHLQPEDRRPLAHPSTTAKRAERQRHTEAMIAPARRLVDVTEALLRDNRTRRLAVACAP